MDAHADLPADLAAVLEDVEAALTAAENALDPFLRAPLAAVSARLPGPLDNARLHTTFAATAATLMYREAGDWWPVGGQCGVWVWVGRARMTKHSGALVSDPQGVDETHY